MTTPPSPFATGPYTAEPEQSDPGVPGPLSKSAKRRLWFLAFLLFAVGCWSGAMMHNGVRHEPLDPDSHITACTEEDGSTQELCSFSGSNGEIINMDYGHYSYYVSTGQVVDFSEGK